MGTSRSTGRDNQQAGSLPHQPAPPPTLASSFITLTLKASSPGPAPPALLQGHPLLFAIPQLRVGGDTLPLGATPAQDILGDVVSCYIPLCTPSSGLCTGRRAGKTRDGLAEVVMVPGQGWILGYLLKRDWSSVFSPAKALAITAIWDIKVDERALPPSPLSVVPPFKQVSDNV